MTKQSNRFLFPVVLLSLNEIIILLSFVTSFILNIITSVKFSRYLRSDEACNNRKLKKLVNDLQVSSWALIGFPIVNVVLSVYFFLKEKSLEEEFISQSTNKYLYT